MQILATYTDELIRIGKEWRFQQRVYRVTCVDYKAPAGEIYREWPAS